MNWAYSAVLLFSTFGMIMLDQKYSLAFFNNSLRASLTVFIGVALFIAWDISGIIAGIFFTGPSPYITGIMLGPDFPLEELFFLVFLCYFTLIIFRLAEEKVWQRT